jgi:RHS repeat-associated protein
MVLAGVLTGTARADMITYFHNDPSGSPVAATDENGRLLWKESYRPYGERLLNGASSDANRLWFTGKPQDLDTGLSYLGARYYSPQLGRFMGIDPKAVDPGDPHSFNRYAYANNNPYRFVDQDGHSPLDVGFLIFDSLKLAAALYTGIGVGEAVADVVISSVALFSPVPGAGEALKAARAVEHGVELARTAEKTAEVARATEEGAEVVAKGLVDDAASAPVGRLGSPMNVPSPQNTPTVINGQTYTGHALDQMQGRGLTPSVIEDTIARGAQTAGRDGAKIFTTDQARVIVNPDGSIKTVYPQ